MSAPGDLIIISFLLKIIKELSTTDDKKIVPVLFQIFESHTADMIDYYVEIYLTLTELKMSEALLYLPYVDLPSDDHRILLLKAWKSFNNGDFVGSGNVVTALKKIFLKTGNYFAFME